DLDDGVEARILSVEQIRDQVPLFARLYNQVSAEYPCTREKVCLLEALKRLFDHFASDLIATTAARLRASGIETLDDIRNLPDRLASLSPQAEAERAQIKRFLYDHLYYSPQLIAHKEHGERIIEDLFRFWMAHPEQLPPTYRQMAGLDALLAPAGALPDNLIVIEPLPRIVCDYIAGMTDSFCLEQHARFLP
ncbi:MAG: deoxyguanosinetriphosphate triphosphohydrolase, partial [Acidobacteriaceae bacterium]